MTRKLRRLSFKTPNREPVMLEVNGIEFQCRGIIPGFVLLDLMGGLESPSSAVQVDAFRQLFVTAMEEEEYQRFMKVCTDPASGVGADTLIDIAQGLAEEYVKRPTEPPTPSQRGRSKTRPTSKGN